MTPSKPTVPVSGRVPALPEEMIKRAAKAICDDVKGYREGLDWPAYGNTARVALAHAGVPGLVQRLTEAERLLADASEFGVRIVADEHGFRGDARLADRIDAFLSVGEGRSRDGDAE